MLCFVTVSGSAALSCKVALRRTVWWRVVGEGTCHVTAHTCIFNLFVTSDFTFLIIFTPVFKILGIF